MAMLLTRLKRLSLLPVDVGRFLVAWKRNAHWNCTRIKNWKLKRNKWVKYFSKKWMLTSNITFWSISNKVKKASLWDNNERLMLSLIAALSSLIISKTTHNLVEKWSVFFLLTLLNILVISVFLNCSSDGLCCHFNSTSWQSLQQLFVLFCFVI